MLICKHPDLKMPRYYFAVWNPDYHRERCQLCLQNVVTFLKQIRNHNWYEIDSRAIISMTCSKQEETLYTSRLCFKCGSNVLHTLQFDVNSLERVWCSMDSRIALPVGFSHITLAIGNLNLISGGQLLQHCWWTHSLSGHWLLYH